MYCKNLWKNYGRISRQITQIPTMTFAMGMTSALAMLKETARANRSARCRHAANKHDDIISIHVWKKGNHDKVGAHLKLLVVPVYWLRRRMHVMLVEWYTRCSCTVIDELAKKSTPQVAWARARTKKSLQRDRHSASSRVDQKLRL